MQQAVRVGAWRFQKCAPAKLEYPPSWTDMISRTILAFFALPKPLREPVFVCGSPSFPECVQVMNLLEFDQCSGCETPAARNLNTGQIPATRSWLGQDGRPWIPAGDAPRSSLPPLLLLLRPRVDVLRQSDALLVTICCFQGTPTQRPGQVDPPPSRGLGPHFCCHE